MDPALVCGKGTHRAVGFLCLASEGFSTLCKSAIGSSQLPCNHCIYDAELLGINNPDEQALEYVLQPASKPPRSKYELLFRSSPLLGYDRAV